MPAQSQFAHDHKPGRDLREAVAQILNVHPARLLPTASVSENPTTTARAWSDKRPAPLASKADGVRDQEGQI